MVRKHPQSPIKKMFKSQPTAEKVMLPVFWDSRGPLLEHYQERGSTVNSACYSTMLCDKLKPAIQSNVNNSCPKGGVFLHDNARPHSATHVANTFQELKSEVLEHPLYSPYLAPLRLFYLVLTKTSLVPSRKPSEAINLS